MFAGAVHDDPPAPARSALPEQQPVQLALLNIPSTKIGITFACTPL